MITKPNIKWIGTDGDFYPNRIDPTTKKQYKAAAIVCHVMQGTMAGTASHFNSPKVSASTQFGISLKGEVHQYVRIEDGAWGNGLVQKGTWPMLAQYPGVNPNLYTISVEFEGKHPDMSKGQFWSPSEEQVKAAIDLFAWLCVECDIFPSSITITGHSQIDAVDRPYCPGPNFPFDEIIEGTARLVLSKPTWGEKEADYLLETGLLNTRPDLDAPVTFRWIVTVLARFLSLYVLKDGRFKA